MLCADRLAAERKVYMDWEISNLDSKRPFFMLWWEKATYFHQLGRSREYSIAVIDNFLERGGYLTVMAGLCTQVGISTENPASTPDFYWSLEHMSNFVCHQKHLMTCF